MINRISENEKEMIRSYIENYAEGGAGAPVDVILKPWEENKSEYLVKMFPESLILEKEISYEKGEDELYESIYDDLLENWSDTKIRDFVRGWKSTFCPSNGWHYNDNEEERTINDMKWEVYKLLNSDMLYSGRWNRDTVEINLPEMEKPIKIQHNAHIMKYIRKFAEIYKIENFEEFRIKHSQILNQKTLKGKLCVSIHPLDFMTMSDNTCGWSSCMSWEESGCYRRGTVEMMNSPCVVVAYLCSKDSLKIGGQEWNSKKWRELYVVHPNGIFNIKSYPYYNEELTKITLSWLKELANAAGIGNYRDEMGSFNADREFHVDGIEYDCEIRPRTDAMYNDFHDNKESFLYLSKDYEGGTWRICYSGPSECMTCGSINVDFDSEENLSCNCCHSEYDHYCYECGCGVDEDDGYYVDGNWYCSSCVDECCYCDNITDEYHINNTGEISVYVASNNGKTYYTDFHITIEDFTFDNLFENYINEGVEPHKLYPNNTWNHDYYVRKDELNEKGLALFFDREFYNWRHRKLEIPSDEEMDRDFCCYDLPELEEVGVEKEAV
jgi:hypothetical protein